MTNPISHLGKQSLFALLSLADLALTWWLLGHSGGQVYEANPVAQLYLTRHGWVGLACFKAGVVLLVLGLAAVISYSRPRLAGGILGLGCAVLAAVVLYGISLSRAAWLSPEQRAAQIAQQYNEHLEDTNREVRELHRKSAAFGDLLAALSQDLIAGRCTLKEAAEQAARSEKAKDPAWLRALAGLYPGRSHQEMMAACVMSHVVTSQEHDQRAAWRVALRLEREFQLTYGCSSPLTHRLPLRGDGPEDGEESAPASGEAPVVPAGPADAPAAL